MDSKPDTDDIAKLTSAYTDTAHVTDDEVQVDVIRTVKLTIQSNPTSTSNFITHDSIFKYLFLDLAISNWKDAIKKKFPGSEVVITEVNGQKIIEIRGVAEDVIIFAVISM